MKHIALYLTLSVAALMDWLITRTVTRVGIFIPKTPAMITVLKGLAQAGQFMSLLATLLAYVVLFRLGMEAFRAAKGRALAVLIFAWAMISLGGMVLGSPIELLGARQWLSVCLVGALGLRIAYERKGYLLPACLALALAQVYALASAAGWEWTEIHGVALFYLGEGCVLLSALALWWRFGRGAAWRVVLLALLPAGLYLGMMIANPAMTAVLAIWSMGLSLYLPAPFYAVALWLALVALLQLARQRDARAWGIALLFCAGFAPQLGVQLAYALIALWLLGLEEEKNRDRAAATIAVSPMVSASAVE